MNGAEGFSGGVPDLVGEVLLEFDDDSMTVPDTTHGTAIGLPISQDG